MTMKNLGPEQVVARFKLKEEFIADAIHKLRTPIAIMKGNVDLALMERKLPKNFKKVLEDINVEIKDLSELLSDLTFLIRKDADFARPMVLEKLDLYKIITKVIRHLRPLCKVKKIKVSSSTKGQALVKGDKIYLEKLFNNLIGNAIKYTPAGGKIEILSQKKNGEVKVDIKDNGIGMSAEDLPHIFDRFYRAKKIRTVEDVGTGLGLPVSRSVAEMHGGTLTALSTLGKGSTFTVTLPLLT